MRIGFDEIYIVFMYGDTPESECIYDSQTAEKHVKRLHNSGYVTAYKKTLEKWFNK